MKFLILLLIFLIGCSNVQDNVECNKNNDCKRTGCSGTICSGKDIITTCEWKEEYACYKLTSCSCINNKCTWKENDEFKKCLEELK